MQPSSVRVLFLSTFEANGMLEFVLIFADGYEKHYSLDEYGIRAYRGASERNIIEDQAKQYLAENGQDTESISLIFI